VFGLEDGALTLQLHQRGGHLQQLVALHVPHTPAEYLGGEGALGDDLLNTTPQLGGRELQHSTCL